MPPMPRSFIASNAQTVTLSATVISADGPVNGGTETFTILNGSNVIGTPVTSNVVSGAASDVYNSRGDSRRRLHDPGRFQRNKHARVPRTAVIH